VTPVLWILAAFSAALVMAVASHIAIGHASAVARRLGAPPFLIGMTLVAIGTDIPEIVNSIMASYAGHGDIGLGDATGSVFTQITFGLGMFPFMASTTIAVERRNVLLLSALTITSLALGATLYGDGGLSRGDAAVLIFTWLGASLIAWRWRSRSPRLRTRSDEGTRPLALHLAATLVSLAFVGGAAAVLVAAVAALASDVGIPEYLLSFFGASIATSLPELTVELVALRKGERDLALGDVFGSCLVDASLAVAAGPLLFPTQVTPDLAHRGAAMAAAGMTLAGATLGARGRHDYRSGTILLICYMLAYFVVIAPAH
jgi:cation:H+ antiporter